MGIKHLTGRPLFGDFVVLITMVIGVLTLMGYGLNQVLSHGHGNEGGSAEDTVIGMLIGSGFLVLQRIIEALKDRWHQMTTENMSRKLHQSSPNHEGDENPGTFKLQDYHMYDDKSYNQTGDET